MKAMATVAGLTGLSRIFGFIRDILTAAILGAGPIADAFIVALKLPNLFRRITAEGAFSVAFVPLYSEKLEKNGTEAADSFASNTFMVMLSILTGFVIIALWVMPWIIYAIAPGFTGDELRFDLAVNLSRITFPYLLLISLTALLGGVLNAKDKFAPFAAAPVLFNLCLIGALLTAGHFETAGHAMAYGILLAGILQLLYLYVSAREQGVKIKIATPRIDINIKKTFKLMGPGVIGAGVMHINLFADLIIASFLKTGSISYLYYADRLNQFPLGMVGIAVGTALLPMLSRAMTKDDLGEAKDLFNRALEMCLLLALPAAIALAIIPTQLISTLFERGAFTATDTATTATVLMAYALGLPAYIAIKVFSTAHWARQDTVTPVKISIIATLINIALSLILIQFIGVAGIALGTGLTGWLQFAMHTRALKTHPAASFDKKFKQNLPKIIASTTIMAATLYALTHITPSGIIGLTILVPAGLLTYTACILLTGTIKTSDIKKYLSKGTS